MKIALTKAPDGTLRPADEEAEEAVKKFTPGEVLKATVTRWRNYRFHRKWFALLTLAFNWWTERGTGKPIEHKGRTALPNLKRFRKDVTIWCGYYELTVDVTGKVRAEAVSIAFENMSQDDFEGLYDKTIDVVLHKVIPQLQLSRGQVDEAVRETIRFI